VKLEITVAEVKEIIKSLPEQPQQFFEMMRSDIQQAVTAYLDAVMRTELTDWLGRVPIPLIPPCDSDGSRHRVPGEAAIPSERSDAGVWCFS
jgi:hypothetical protein